MGLSYIDLKIVLQIYSEKILNIQSPPKDILSLITCIRTNTSHNGMLEEAKLKLQSLKREPSDDFKIMYVTIVKKVSKVIQLIHLLALCENYKKKKEKHLNSCKEITAVNTMDLASHMISMKAFYTLLTQIKTMLTIPTT